MGIRAVAEEVKYLIFDMLKEENLAGTYDEMHFETKEANSIAGLRFNTHENFFKGLSVVKSKLYENGLLNDIQLMMHAVTTKLDVTSATPFDYHNKLYSLLGANKVQRLSFDVKNPNAHFIFEQEKYAESFYRRRKSLEMKDRKMYVYWLGDRDPVNMKLYGMVWKRYFWL